MSRRRVLDTNVLVSALFWDGNERRVLTECLHGDRQLVASPFILGELDDVLEAKFDAPDDKRGSYVRTLLVHAELVRPDVEVEVTGDEADDRVLAAALAGEADVLVTGDRDLLGLGSWKGIRICSAAELV